MNVCEMIKMANEDGSTNVELLGREAAVSGDKAKCGADDLVHADNFTWSSGLAYTFKITNTLVDPWLMMCLTIGTTGASGRIHTSEVLRNEAIPSHRLQSGEAEVSEGFMNGEES